MTARVRHPMARSDMPWRRVSQPHGGHNGSQMTSRFAVRPVRSRSLTVEVNLPLRFRAVMPKPTPGGPLRRWQVPRRQILVRCPRRLRARGPCPRVERRVEDAELQEPAACDVTERMVDSPIKRSVSPEHGALRSGSRGPRAESIVAELRSRHDPVDGVGYVQSTQDRHSEPVASNNMGSQALGPSVQ